MKVIEGSKKWIIDLNLLKHYDVFVYISREKLVIKVTEALVSPPEDEEEILKKYRAHSLVIDKEITVLPISKEPYSARVLEILGDYSLLVERENGEKERLFTGEVSIKANEKR